MRRTTEFEFTAPSAAQVTQALQNLAAEEDEVARATRNLGTSAGQQQAALDRLAKEAGESVPRAMERMRVATAREREEALRLVTATAQGEHAVRALRVQLAGEAAERRALARVKGEATAAQRAEAAAIRANVEATERSRMALRDLENQTNRNEGAAARFGRRMMLTAAGIAAAFLSIRSAGRLANLADEMTLLEGRLNIVTGSAYATQRAFGDLYRTAQDTGGGLRPLGDLYVAVSANAEELNIRHEDTIRLTRAVSQAYVISGASAMEAAQSTRQLVQALASGELRGEEFRSITENARRLASGMATAMDTTIGGLRKMSKEGELTADVVVQAVLEMSGTFEREFQSLPPTIGRARQRLGNSFSLLVRNLDEVTDASAATAEGLEAFAGGVETLAFLLNPADLENYAEALRRVKAQVEDDSWVRRLAMLANPNTAGAALGDILGLDAATFRLLGLNRELEGTEGALAEVAAAQERVGDYSLTQLQQEYAGLQMQILAAQAAVDSARGRDRDEAERALVVLRAREAAVTELRDAAVAAAEDEAGAAAELSERYRQLVEDQAVELNAAQRRLAAAREGEAASRRLEAQLAREATERAALRDLEKEAADNAAALAASLGVEADNAEALASAIAAQAAAMGDAAAQAVLYDQQIKALDEGQRELQQILTGATKAIADARAQQAKDAADIAALERQARAEWGRARAMQAGAAALAAYDREQAIANELAKFATRLTDEQAAAVRRAAGAAYDAAAAQDALADRAQSAAEVAAEAWRNAGEDFQRTVTDVIADGLDGAIDDFDSAKDAIVNIWKRLGAQLIAAPLVLPTQQAFASVYGGLGAAAGAGGGPAAAAGTVPGAALLYGPAALGALGLGSGAAATLPSSALLYGPAAASMPGAGAAAGGFSLSALNPFSAFNPGKLSASFVKAGLPGFAGSALGVLGTGFMGAGIGNLAAGLLGYNNKESQFGGGAGALAGLALGGPVGALIGGLGGGLLGGLIGGKPNPYAQTGIAFQGGRFVQTGTTSKDKGPAAEIGQAGASIVQTLNGVLPALKELGVDLSALGGITAQFGYSSRGDSGKGFFGSGGVRNAQDAEAAAQAVVFDTLRTALMASPPEGLGRDIIARIFSTDDIDQAMGDLEFAARFGDAIEAMNASSLDFAKTVRGEVITALNAQLDQLQDWADTAQRLGMAGAESDAAMRAYVETLAGIRDAGEGATQAEAALAALEARFEVLAERAPAFGVALDAIAAAEARARQTLLSGALDALDAAANAAQGREHLNALAGLQAQFEALRAEAIVLDAEFGGLAASEKTLGAIAAQFRAFLDGLSPDQIREVLAAWDDMPAYLQAVLADALDVAGQAAIAAADRQAAEAARAVESLVQDAERVREQAQRSLESALGAEQRVLQQQIDAVSVARQALIRDYQQEARAIEAARDTWRDLAESLAQARGELTRLNAGAGPLADYGAARSRLLDVQAGVASGDEAALRDAAAAATGFLAASERRSASRLDFERDRALAQRILRQAEDAAAGRADVLDLQLETLQAQVSELADLNEGVLTLQERMAQVAEAIESGEAAAAQLAALNAQAAELGLLRDTGAAALEQERELALAAFQKADAQLVSLKQQAAQLGLLRATGEAAAEQQRAIAIAAYTQAAADAQALRAQLAGDLKGLASAVGSQGAAMAAALASMAQSAEERRAAEAAAKAAQQSAQSTGKPAGPSQAEKKAALDRRESWALNQLLAVVPGLMAEAQRVTSSSKGPRYLTDRGYEASLLGVAAHWWDVHSGGVVPFAQGGLFMGGMLTEPEMFSFNRGGRIGIRAEAGDEVVAPVVRMPDGQIGVRSAPAYDGDLAGVLQSEMAMTRQVLESGFTNTNRHLSKIASAVERWDVMGLYVRGQSPTSAVLTEAA